MENNSIPELVPSGFWARLAALAVDVAIFLVIVSMLGVPPVSDRTYSYDYTAGGMAVSAAPVPGMDQPGTVVPWGDSAGFGLHNRRFISRTRSLHLSLFLWVLYCGLLVWRLGATPGKMLFKMRVVDAATGKKLGADKAFLRSLYSILSLRVVFLGYIWAWLEKEGRAWHDLIPGTMVVKDGV